MEGGYCPECGGEDCYLAYEFEMECDDVAMVEDGDTVVTLTDMENGDNLLKVYVEPDRDFFYPGDRYVVEIRKLVVEK